MNKTLLPISDNEFRSKVYIKFNNILDGFNLFKNITIEASNIENGENNFIEFIEKVFEKNNSECYVDFYINRISDTDKKRLIELIPAEDKKILKKHLIITLLTY